MLRKCGEQMTQQQTPNRALDEKIDAFEKALQATRVAGELSDWIYAVGRGLNELKEEYKRQASNDHRTAFRKILNEDVVMQPTVAKLREADEQIMQKITEVENLVASVAVQLNASNDQREDLERTGKVFEMGQQILFSVRKQEQDLTTWYIEAFQRDNGVGD
jgi:hypothetical protein